MSGYDYDLFVIGAGSGGVRAARIAAGYGARVAIAEEYRVGGTCVIRGCVPKKLLVYASKFGEEFEDAAGFGWSVGETKFDWKTLIANKDREIDRLNKVYLTNLERSGVEIVMSRATVAGPNEVRLLADDRTVSAKYILIATGATPFLDSSVTGIEHAITSNEAFHLEDFPERVTVVGGGYIAVEFAGIFAGLGARTTLLYRGEEILRGFDMDMRTLLHEEMEKKGIDVITGDRFTAIEKSGAALVGRTEAGRTIEADQIMYAIGRRPATAGLGLEEAGVELTKNGAVVVDAQSKSSVASIYAVGDATDRVNLTPVAIREGHAFADTVFGARNVTVDHSNIATAVFSQPEIGTVGLTEDEACDRFDAVDIYRARFRAMKHTLTGRDERMLMKVIVDAASDTVLGVHVMGPDAGEMAQLLGIAIKMGATKADFDRTVAVHPTAAEELVTMREPSERYRAREAHVAAAGIGEAAVGSAGAGEAAKPVTGVEVREARETDFAILAKIGMHSWQASIGSQLAGDAWKRLRDEKPFEHLLASAGGPVLVATLDGEPVGFAIVASGQGAISEIWVAPSAWANGAGEALLAALEEALAARDAKYVDLDLFAGNRRALRFFRTRGFSDRSREKRYDNLAGTEIDTIRLRKPLAT
ncbi:glutathione reductase (NADPH) [Rhodobium orientis]|uniref:Glutathione reductase n=3 Tax=Rhodobium orientis TaxID=34017 RepID=A0A327JX83_9HYPH|nr:glutathione reductase (NADPH) [Rhodobium orientis]RAI29582.1 glutathione-disulfide reductase [Rhodobium orientis]